MKYEPYLSKNIIIIMPNISEIFIGLYFTALKTNFSFSIRSSVLIWYKNTNCTFLLCRRISKFYLLIFNSIHSINSYFLFFFRISQSLLTRTLAGVKLRLTRSSSWGKPVHPEASGPDRTVLEDTRFRAESMFQW